MDFFWGVGVGVGKGGVETIGYNIKLQMLLLRLGVIMKTRINESFHDLYAVTT